jgi:hypothetical protein
MACEGKQTKIGTTAGRQAGLSAVQSRTSNVIGRAATTALAALESFDGPPSMDSLTAGVVGLEAAAWLGALGRKPTRRMPVETMPGSMVPAEATLEPVPDWWTRGIEQKRRVQGADTGQRPPPNRVQQAEFTAGRMRKAALLAVGALKLGQTASAFIGTGLARLSRQERASAEQRFFFPNTTKLPVGVWPSRLTPLLNRLDGGQGDGVMFEVKGKTWHRGTVALKTGGGERTITHLQSLSLPQTHYYFDRRLSDNEAIGLVSGQKGFEPKYMAGYVGQVSEVESLAPAWAAAKTGLIRARLRWGGAAPVKAAPAAQPPPPDGDMPALERVGERVRLGGQEYPVMVRRVVTSPLDGRRRADAAYYDEAGGVWKEVTDEAARSWLAEQVQQGKMDTWEREA